MSIIHQALEAIIPVDCRQGAVTIGNFDGVHLGHQALLTEASRQAKIISGPSVAVTFDPHPQQLLRPAEFQPTLTTLEQRVEHLQNYGIDRVLILKISEAFLKLSAREFFDRLIGFGLQARAVVEGFNFAFGRAREGTTEVLRTFCQQAGIALSLLPAQELFGKAVSTSRVRTELVAGNVAVARQLLGRPYSLAGLVGTGQKRGQTLGFPTANLHDVATLIPGNGVYGVRVWHNQKAWPGAAHIGPNPTFGDQARKIEVHLIGFQGDLYNVILRVHFLERIRETRQFSSAAELTEQLKKDVESVMRGEG